MSVNYAVRESKSAPLSSDFARSFVERQYGALAAQTIYSLLPTYQRGPRKGLPKGWVLWTKCVKGGWVKTGRYDDEAMRASGFVCSPGTHDVQIVLTNPNFIYDGRAYGIEAGARREGMTEDEWATFCASAIISMKGRS